MSQLFTTGSGGGGGGGDVTGPASSTDNAIARFDLTTGKIIKNSVAILADNGTLIISSANLDGMSLTGGASSASMAVTFETQGGGEARVLLRANNVTSGPSYYWSWSQASDSFIHLSTNPTGPSRNNYAFGIDFSDSHTLKLNYLLGASTVTPSTGTNLLSCTTSGNFTIGNTSTNIHRFNTVTQSTVGSAGAASALPLTPTGYWEVNINGNNVVVPYYDQA